MKQITVKITASLLMVGSLATGVMAATTMNPDGTITSSTTAACSIPKDINSLFTYALCLIDYAVPVLISIALVLFLIGVIRFVAAGDNEEKRQGGRDLMIFGIIALFVMVSVWGFVNILSNTLFGKNAVIQSLPPKSTNIFE